ncbi:MAG: hypothetical protein KF743_13885 [Fimbriimonadaceae bacterium]|nr:hypothetical protein [Fimbriimonadaceae bacterium]
MSNQPKPTSADALKSIVEFAFDAEEQVDGADMAQIDDELRSQGTDPGALVKRMKQFLSQQQAELLANEVGERRKTIVANAGMFTLPALPEMRQAIVNYGFAARLEDEMTEDDIRALYQQVQALIKLNEEDQE